MMAGSRGVHDGRRPPRYPDRDEAVGAGVGLLAAVGVGATGTPLARLAALAAAAAVLAALRWRPAGTAAVCVLVVGVAAGGGTGRYGPVWAMGIAVLLMAYLVLLDPTAGHPLPEPGTDPARARPETGPASPEGGPGVTPQRHRRAAPLAGALVPVALAGVVAAVAGFRLTTAVWLLPVGVAAAGVALALATGVGRRR
jgi:hypothetical protein